MNTHSDDPQVRTTSNAKSSSPKARGRHLKALQRAISIGDLRNLARARLPRAVFDFYDGGAESEQTLRGNLAAFQQYRLIPRYMVNVADVDTRTNIAGRETPLPLAISPTGAIGFGWPFGDVAIARAAGEFGIPYSLPTSATSSIERVAREAPDTRLWFQSYMFRKRSYTFSLIERAMKAGYEALIITIDMPTGGRRERDFHNDFGLPFRFTYRNVLDFASRPSWAIHHLHNGMPQLENLTDFTPDAVTTKAIASSVGKQYDPSFVWSDLPSIRKLWPRKLYVKGILHPEDAILAVNAGADGVIVSNHGGRQLDSARASLDALPDVVQAVGHRTEVLLDGGIRRGTDVLKAMALGARAVMVGRPALYSVSVAGEVGVSHMLTLLQDELTRAMALCGVPILREASQEILSPQIDTKVRFEEEMK